jgi:hypothetical protein
MPEGRRNRISAWMQNGTLEGAKSPREELGNAAKWKGTILLMNMLGVHNHELPTHYMMEFGSIIRQPGRCGGWKRRVFGIVYVLLLCYSV